MVEHELDLLLRDQFKRKDDSTWASLTSDVGPLYTFSQKINAGYAFGLYDEDIRDNLKIIKNIRNAFAHSKHLVDFSNDSVVKQLRSVVLPKKKHAKRMRNLKLVKHQKGPPSASYIILCLAVDTELLKRRTRGWSAQLRNRMRGKGGLINSPMYNSLLASALAQSLPTTGKEGLQQIL